MDGPLPGEDDPPRRPRVVDKRVSARPETPAEAPSPDALPADAQPGPEPTGAAPVPPAPQEPLAAPATEAGATPPPPHAPEDLWTPEQEEQARRFAQEVRDTPSRDWILNSAVTLANVAATKLDAGLADDAQLAIDALAGLVDSVGAHLGDAEAPLRQTVAQLQMAYTQVVPPPRHNGGS